MCDLMCLDFKRKWNFSKINLRCNGIILDFVVTNDVKACLVECFQQMTRHISDMTIENFSPARERNVCKNNYQYFRKFIKIL